MRLVDTEYTRIGLFLGGSWPWIRVVFRFRPASYRITESPEDRELFEQCFEVASR